jgi:hypothetical protein
LLLQHQVLKQGLVERFGLLDRALEQRGESADDRSDRRLRRTAWSPFSDSSRRTASVRACALRRRAIWASVCVSCRIIRS